MFLIPTGQKKLIKKCRNFKAKIECSRPKTQSKKQKQGHKTD